MSVVMRLHKCEDSRAVLRGMEALTDSPVSCPNSCTEGGEDSLGAVVRMDTGLNRLLNHCLNLPSCLLGHIWGFMRKPGAGHCVLRGETWHSRAFRIAPSTDFLPSRNRLPKY